MYEFINLFDRRWVNGGCADGCKEVAVNSLQIRMISIK